MYTKHSAGPHGRCKTTVWSPSSMRSCPVRHKAQVTGRTVLRQEASCFKAEDSCCPDTCYFSHYLLIPPIQMHGNTHRNPGKPSSDVNCDFILTYISESVPCPTPHWQMTKAGLLGTCTWPSLGVTSGLLMPQTSSIGLRGAYRPAPLWFTLWLMEARGHMLSLTLKTWPKLLWGELYCTLSGCSCQRCLLTTLASAEFLFSAWFN